MSTRKYTRRLQTIPEFLQSQRDSDHPISESKLRWALRNRQTNGFPPVYTRHGSKALVFDGYAVERWFAATVPA